MKTLPSDARIEADELQFPMPSGERLEAIRVHEQEAERIRRLENSLTLWKASGVPARHRDALDGLPNSGPWAEASADLNSLLGTGCICVLMGIRGTGKTQMAVKAVKETCRRQGSAAYVKAMQIFLDIRDTFGTERSEKAAVNRYAAPQLLVIDAMEERGETSFEDRILNHIIDIRYDSLKDTILITNQTQQAFAESSGPSIVSRIHETGRTIVCNWPSFREQGRVVALERGKA